MLPEFPELKRKLNRLLARMLREQLPLVAPLLEDISTFTQHEGKRGELTRADSSTDSTDFEIARIGVEISKDDMRVFSPEKIRRRIRDFAEQLAEHQSRLMLTRVGEAAAAVGNSVDAKGELKPEHLLDAMRSIHVDFDPETLKPKPGLKFVLHPDTAAKLMPKVKEWEQDPAIIAELQKIEDHQREEWRAREARRTLVD
jgi:hypothetical protein